MTALIVLSLLWAALVAAALVAALATTAWNLHRARRNLAGIADDLEAIGRLAEPLDGKLQAVGGEVEAVVAALGRVDAALDAVLEAVAALRATGRP